MDKARADRMSRREFIRRGMRFAGLTGIARPWASAATRTPSSRSVRTPRPISPLAEPSPDSASTGFFGAQTHFGQFRSGIDELLGLVKNAGIGWIRDEVYWSQVEKEKGIFEFPPAYDQYLKAAQELGIRVLLILDFGNVLYTGSEKGGPAAEPARLAFARYCAAVVKRYRLLGVQHYEIWNEPNASMFWRPQPNPEDYAALLETAYRACKEADPGSTVLGCSTAGTDLDFVGGVFAAGGGRLMDAVSFHPYCQPTAPEKKLWTDISRLKAIAAGKPLWITEFGYPTHTGPGGVDEETQANYFVRAFLLARASGSVERMFWYDFQNDGDDPDEGEFNFGLVRMDKTPKPAYGACKTMISLVGGLAPAELKVIGNTYVLRFGEGPGALTAVWRLGGSESVQIPCPGGQYRVFERDGESRSVETTEVSLEVTASEAPRYIAPLVR